jgi:hypothetical protein
MANQNNVGRNTKGEDLLSEQERVAFKLISTGNDLHGQRAIALLAINDGATQAQAAQQAGLTPGQVKYWLTRFREIRLAIFPEQILESTREDPISTQQDMEEIHAPVTETTPKKGNKQPAKEAKKKKTKKSKAKKTKQTIKKKDKKSKKTKGKGKTKKKKKKSK